jgi:putative DNA primase/helicase
MRFEDFARIHGLILGDVTPFRWMATPTEDHPHKRNGRYKFMGDIGWVQNWATMDKPAMWKTDDRNALNPELQRKKISFDSERQKLAKDAQSRATWIISQCQHQTHEYLAKKGFPDEESLIWNTDKGDKLIVIPMRFNGEMVGCQLINEQGEKKFLYGQQTKGASFRIGAKGIPIFCEGFATGLSIRTVMQANKLECCIYICFSAGNMQEVSRQVPSGFVIADNDSNHTGESTAQKTGKPYWISDTVGEDFNDYHLRVGTFKASQSIKPLVYKSKPL